ncbi:hypothetical protein U1Q18_024522 [Sarracenia purpurea var. burkii]
MDATRLRSIVFSLGFVFALAVVRSEGNRRILGTLFCYGIPSISQELDQDTAVQVWIHCRQEMEERTEALQDFDFYLLHTSNKINSDAVLLAKRKLQKQINDLPPQTKQTLLDCLRRKKFASPTSSHKVVGTRSLFNKCLELIFGWSNVPRRNLQSSRQILGSPAPAPGPAAAVAPPFLPPASSPNPIPQPPATAPEPPSLPPSSHLSPPLPPKVKHPPPHFVSRSLPPPPPPPRNNSSHWNTAVIATSASAVAILALLAVLFFCCLRRNRNKRGPKDGQRDDKPLLNLCLSDMSGSSQKSQSVGNLSDKDFKNSSSAHHLNTDNHGSSLVQSQTSEGGACGTNHSLLPLPPGRTAPPPPPGPPPPPPKPPAPRPPPPPKAVRPPPVPLGKPSSRRQGRSSSGGGDDLSAESDSQKTKLKPFFWDKVLANPDHSMVWHELKAGSFQVNEEMMETLFGYTNAEKTQNERRRESSSFDSPQHYIQIIDAKKSQNLAILLKALNVTTEEVCDALKEGTTLLKILFL